MEWVNDGWQSCREQSDDDQGNHIPFLQLTACLPLLTDMISSRATVGHFSTNFPLSHAYVLTRGGDHGLWLSVMAGNLNKVENSFTAWKLTEFQIHYTFTTPY